MNIEINRDQLLPALSTTSSVVEKRQTLPILSNLLIQKKQNTLSITGSDLEVEVNKLIGGVSPDNQNAEVTLSSNKILEICRALPIGSNIKINVSTEGKAIVTSGKSRFTLKTLPVSEYPALQTINFEDRFTISTSEFKKILGATSFSMATQDVRYYLNGILLEIEGNNLVAVATDGHRLAKSETTLDSHHPEKHQIIVPRKAIQEIGRLLNSVEENDDNATVKVELNKKHVRLSAGDTVITSTLINGNFPEYRSILSAELDKKIKVDRKLFLEALMRTSVLTNDRLHGVRLRFDNNEIKISTNNPEQEEAEDEIPCEYMEEEILTSFNVNYIIEALKAIDSETINLNIKDKDSVCVIDSPTDEKSVWLVMPMRL
ncbi:MAG: DNA polymerase-3 subunit beta [Neolewinella sp.]|jgi:DNA polymerase-3 subunit beta